MRLFVGMHWHEGVLQTLVELFEYPHYRKAFLHALPLLLCSTSLRKKTQTTFYRQFSPLDLIKPAHVALQEGGSISERTVLPFKT